MAERPLSARLREAAERLDFIGGDGDQEAVLQAAELAEVEEREERASAQSSLEVSPDGRSCAICELRIDPASEAFYHEEQGWTQPRAQGGTHALRGRRVTGKVAHAKCVEQQRGQRDLGV